jgi:hypothetical protein
MGHSTPPVVPFTTCPGFLYKKDHGKTSVGMYVKIATSEGVRDIHHCFSSNNHKFYVKIVNSFIATALFHHGAF